MKRARDQWEPTTAPSPKYTAPGKLIIMKTPLKTEVQTNGELTFLPPL
jgi:hypothetical protein